MSWYPPKEEDQSQKIATPALIGSEIAETLCRNHKRPKGRHMFGNVLWNELATVRRRHKTAMNCIHVWKFPNVFTELSAMSWAAHETTLTFMIFHGKMSIMQVLSKGASGVDRLIGNPISIASVSLPRRFFQSLFGHSRQAGKRAFNVLCHSCFSIFTKSWTVFRLGMRYWHRLWSEPALPPTRARRGRLKVSLMDQWVDGAWRLAQWMDVDGLFEKLGIFLKWNFRFFP